LIIKGTSIKIVADMDSSAKRITQQKVFVTSSIRTLYNFNKDAYGFLEVFGEKVKAELAKSEVLHVDETSINKNGDRYWLHSASSNVTRLVPKFRLGNARVREAPASYTI